MEMETMGKRLEMTQHLATFMIRNMIATLSRL